MADNAYCIIHAYEFDGKGGGIKLANDEAAASAKSEKLAWVHLDATHPDTRKWLKENVSYLDTIILDALLAEETRPRSIQHEDGLLVIFRGVNLNEGMEPEDMVSIRLWIDKSRIITMRRRPLMAMQDIAGHLEKGKGPKNAGDFMVRLTTRLFQRMEPIISELDDRTDVIEERILDNPDVSLRLEIVDIRKMAIMMRRYLAPQKDAISNIRSSDVSWIDVNQGRRLQENQDRMTRYVEDLDAIRERAQIVKDELANILADRMNKNMYVLSVVAAIFLPLGFLTGLLGINVGGMPGAEYDLAFWIVCLICVVFGVGLMALFRFMKWL